MLNKLIIPPWAVSRRIGHGVWAELYLSWRFIVRDISATVIPALCFMIAAWYSQAPRLDTLWMLLVKGSLYFWLYCYTFCLSNQLGGIEEDRINKPDRPLITGLVSVQGARLRWVISMVLFTLVGWWFGVLEWTLLWQAVLTVHNFTGVAQLWYGKNLSMSLGTLAELAAAWQLVTPITPRAWTWILLLAIVMFPLFSAQDLRDMVGDKAAGRRTFPLVVGESAARIFLSVGFLILPFVIGVVALIGSPYAFASLLVGVGLAGICSLIAFRILCYRSKEADHRTYMLFTYWYCFVLAGVIIVQ